MWIRLLTQDLTLPHEKYYLLRNIHTKDFYLQYLVQVTHTQHPYNSLIYKLQKAEGMPFKHIQTGVSLPEINRLYSFSRRLTSRQF